MIEYRLRFVSNGKLYRHESFEAPDEASAIRRAAAEAGAAPAELWCAGRKVRAFNQPEADGPLNHVSPPGAKAPAG